MNEIMWKYQEMHGVLKEEVLHMTIKEHHDLDNATFLNEKEHKDFQHNIGVCQWLIVAGSFGSAYYVSSLSNFSKDIARALLSMNN